MRMPTPARTLYAWWNAALDGDTPSVHDGLPECGWFKMRMVRGGPWVAVEICVEREIDSETGELESDEKMVAFVDGQRRNPVSIWTYLTPISRADFEALQKRQAATPAMQATHVRMDLSLEPTRP